MRFARSNALFTGENAPFLPNSRSANEESATWPDSHADFGGGRPECRSIGWLNQDFDSQEEQSRQTHTHDCKYVKEPEKQKAQGDQPLSLDVTLT
jgi:hypothetical protein